MNPFNFFLEMNTYSEKNEFSHFCFYFWSHYFYWASFLFVQIMVVIIVTVKINCSLWFYLDHHVYQEFILPHFLPFDVLYFNFHPQTFALTKICSHLHFFKQYQKSTRSTTQFYKVTDRQGYSLGPSGPKKSFYKLLSSIYRVSKKNNTQNGAFVSFWAYWKLTICGPFGKICLSNYLLGGIIWA